MVDYGKMAVILRLEIDLLLRNMVVGVHLYLSVGVEWNGAVGVEWNTAVGVD